MENSYKKGYNYIFSEPKLNDLEILVEIESNNLINSYSNFVKKNDEDTKDSLDYSRGKIDAILDRYSLNKLPDSVLLSLKYSLEVTNTTPKKEVI